MKDVDASGCRQRAMALARRADDADDYAVMVLCESLSREWLRLAILLEAEAENIDTIDLHVSERLRTFRTNAGLDFSELGARSGVAVQKIQLYESGAVAAPASVIWRLAQGLEQPVTAFYPSPVAR